MKSLIIRFRIFILKLKFSDINDEITNYHLKLLIKNQISKSKIDIVYNLTQYKLIKYSEKRKIANKIFYLKSKLQTIN